MLRRLGFGRDPAGFTIIETLIAITLLTVGLVSLAVLVVSSTRQTEFEDDRQKVLDAAQNLLEQVKADDPLLIVANYDGEVYPIEGVDGTVAVNVDATVPSLLGVTVTATWNTAGNDMTIVLETEIYNANG